MISFAPWRPAPETRSYTTAVVNAIESAAAGTGGGVAAATAAIEVASSTWARALSLATVEPMNRRTAAVTPSLLAMIGRALCRSGEIVFDLQVTGGRLMMLPASAAYVVVGSGDRRTWLYTVTVDGPGSTMTVYRERSGVAHLQYMVDPVRPWLGRPPWASASLSGSLLAGIERQLSGEAGGPSGYVLPVPDVGDKGQGGDDGQGEDDDGEDDPIVALRRDLAAAGGKTMIAPTQQAGYGAGPAAAPAADYKSSRFGFNPPDSALEARRDLERSILAACGVPPVLANHAAPGTSMREAWRQMTVGTVEPIAVIVASQLSEALGVDVKLTMPRAADVATLARAVGSLVAKAGMPLADARAAVGF